MNQSIGALCWANRACCLARLDARNVQNKQKLIKIKYRNSVAVKSGSQYEGFLWKLSKSIFRNNSKIRNTKLMNHRTCPHTSQCLISLGPGPRLPQYTPRSQVPGLRSQVPGLMSHVPGPLDSLTLTPVYLLFSPQFVYNSSPDSC